MIETLLTSPLCFATVTLAANTQFSVCFYIVVNVCLSVANEGSAVMLSPPDQDTIASQILKEMIRIFMQQENTVEVDICDLLFLKIPEKQDNLLRYPSGKARCVARKKASKTKQKYVHMPPYHHEAN